MPNGASKNWICLCGAIDGSRSRYNKWPTKVRLYPDINANIHEILGPNAHYFLYQKTSSKVPYCGILRV
jgi:hypothetical protein